MLDKIEKFFANDNWLEMLLPIATNLLAALAIYIIGGWIARQIMKAVDKLMSLRGMDAALAKFLHAISSTVLSFIVLLIAVEQLGIDTTSLLAILGAAGLAVGLALKDSLSNFAAGVMLIVFKPFKLGDYVEAGGVAGVVEQISIFNTIFRSPDNKEIIVPNALIYGDVIVNVSARATRRVDMIIGISYDDDMRKARDLIWQVLKADERILQEPEAVVAVGELGDSSVNFVVRPWCRTEDFWAVKWDFLENIKRSFDDNGISIPYPQRDVHLYSEGKNQAGV